MWNILNARVDCNHENNNVSEKSANDTQEQAERKELSMGNESQMSNGRRRRANERK